VLGASCQPGAGHRETRRPDALHAPLVALDEATRRAAAVRDRLARLEAEPKRLDPRRALANIESKLAKLGENLDAAGTTAQAQIVAQARWRRTVGHVPLWRRHE
jgi:hypothetical protein